MTSHVSLCGVAAKDAGAGVRTCDPVTAGSRAGVWVEERAPEYGNVGHGKPERGKEERNRTGGRTERVIKGAASLGTENLSFLSHSDAADADGSGSDAFKPTGIRESRIHHDCQASREIDARQEEEQAKRWQAEYSPIRELVGTRGPECSEAGAIYSKVLFGCFFAASALSLTRCRRHRLRHICSRIPVILCARIFS